ncbi:MAG: hypothetical protein QW290_10040 [Sulfolobales archaeon]
MERLDVVRGKLDLLAKVELLKQVIHVVERSPTKEEALNVLRRLLAALEAEYEALLLEDPVLKWASLGLSENGKRL